ncbi:site-specific integrase [Pelagivirga sediminicola]|uniref:site-specific integrase n=1 Tax=Pelagivirga sediminicola TaxID=2170575 RepID=UPI0014031782|nr:tyrosine-type recombinase/integrase [Pelagivirga sediminicola]
MKHVTQTKSGRWQYRRRVPKEVAQVIGKGEFKGILGDSRNEALAAYPKFHAVVEREIAKANEQAGGAVAADRGELTEHEAYPVARARAEYLASRASGRMGREAIIEAIASQYEMEPDTLDPIGATDVDRLTINILRNGVEATKRPVPTLQDAKKLYLAERRGKETPEAFKRFEGQVNQFVNLTQKALGRDAALTELTREDARTVRDHMLDQVKADGKRISPASVSRYLNGLKAIINFAATEMDLPDTFRSPFNNLSVPQDKARSGAGDGDKRDPLPPEVLKAMRARLMAHTSKPDLALIWRMLAGTGCRLGEVTGLRVRDVDTAAEYPHIKVEWHENRRLKTQASIRHVPLTGDALEAAKEAIKLAGDSDMLFASYGRGRGSDAASAILNKHLRAVTADKLHVVHSLRHNMKDWLMLAEVSSLDQNLILGHALGAVGDRVYGGGPARLKITTRALTKALEVAAGAQTIP